MSFAVADNGDYVDGIYSTRAASVVYSLLIGRKTPPQHLKKSDFTEADIIYKGYLSKEGSWVKSWKNRYFVLRSDIRELCYYASKEDMTLIGSVMMDENTCVWTNKADGDHNFVLSWTPPKDSSSSAEKREMRLRANDAKSKTLWMEHITAEASRQHDLVLKDWWVDLFGNVFYQRKGDEIESRKNLEIVRKGLEKFAIASNTAATTGNVSGENAGKECSDDMDARAEQLALKVLSKMRDRRKAAGDGGITSMSGLFAAMDEEMESDDSSVEEEDLHVEIDAKKTIVEKIAVEEEEDCDEDFLFSRGTSVPEQEDSNEKKVIVDDSDDESDEDEMTKKRQTSRDSKKFPMVKSKSVTKTKKEVKFNPPPLPDTHADRFDVDGDTLKGLCISVELSNILEGNEKISCTLSSANLNASGEWKVISNTENYKLIEEKVSSSNSGAKRVAHQFQLLQDPRFLQDSTHMLVIVYKASGKKVAKDQKQKSEHNTPLCSGIVRCDELLETGGITQVKMKISDGTAAEVAKPSISKEESSYNAVMSSEESAMAPSANLGVLILSSSLMYRRRMKLTSDMRCRPYCENMYCFRTVSGEDLVLEQLYASRYSLSVAKAMLSLIIPERKKILSETKKIVKNDLKKAISALKNIPSKAALQELDDMLTGGGEFDGKNTIETVSRAETLQRTKNMIKDISSSMIDNYEDCNDHCTQSLRGEPFPGMVISPDVGGSQLRRSVWKKSPVWQFCTTNLNVNVLTWRKFSDNDIKSRAHIDTSVTVSKSEDDSDSKPNSCAEAKLATAASITFGAPAAHGYGFHDGGIRRLMAGLGTNDATRIKWMCLLQASGGVTMDLLKKSSGDYAKEFKKLFDVHVDMVTGDGWTNVFQKASKLAMRIDACASQALGFALTSIKTVLTLATYGEERQTNALANAFSIKNFLIPVESFLSTQGHEMGMIEDLEASILWLSSVTVRLVSSCSQPDDKVKSFGMCDDICIRRDATGAFVVDLEMNQEEITTIKRILAMSEKNGVAVDDISVNMDKKESNKDKDVDAEVFAEFKLTGVLFTCGVNEMQSLVNLSGGKEAYKQNEINNESFERLKKYLASMNVQTAKQSNQKESQASGGDKPQQWNELLFQHNNELKATLDVAQSSPHVKTPGVLVRSARICREISGTVGILCKSGKDRTSMGVTLEQACILSDGVDYILDGQEATRVMRKYGVRRMNVYANTGQGYYAFNSFQQNMLPKCYRPPGGTYGGSVAS